jgi:hypothetical protein
MGALTGLLFPPPARRSPASILKWWERRRPAYNVAVGAAGAFSLLAMTGIMRIPPHPFEMRTGVPWQTVVAFGVLANVCYLLGPTVEILAHKLWGSSVLPIGPALYRMGLTFTVGLALLPTLLAIIQLMVRIVISM